MGSMYDAYSPSAFAEAMKIEDFVIFSIHARSFHFISSPMFNFNYLAC